MNKGALWQNKLNTLILKSIEDELLCETDITSIINNSLGQKLGNAIISSRFAAFDNRLRHLVRLHALDIAMIGLLLLKIEFVESGSINYCFRTVLVSSNEFLPGKNMRVYIFAKKDTYSSS